MGDDLGRTEGPSGRREREGDCSEHKKGHRPGSRQQGWGQERLIMPHLSYKNPGVRLRPLVCYTDVADSPRDLIGLGLCRKVNCSDHRVQAPRTDRRPPQLRTGSSELLSPLVT